MTMKMKEIKVMMKKKNNNENTVKYNKYVSKEMRVNNINNFINNKEKNKIIKKEIMNTDIN